MRRYIILFLITGIVWAQTDFDTLVMKDGTTYLGEYSKTEKEIVYFKTQNAFAFQPVPIKLIKFIKLKDGDYIIGESSKSNDALILKDKSVYNGYLLLSMGIFCGTIIYITFPYILLILYANQSPHK